MTSDPLDDAIEGPNLGDITAPNDVADWPIPTAGQPTNGIGVTAATNKDGANIAGTQPVDSSLPLTAP